MLTSFFNPIGVAVIGASRDPHKLGYGVIRNLVEYHYKGNIYPVNPVASEILGHRCYPAIGEVPDPVDLAVIVVPASRVNEAVDACGERGIRHAIVVSGGFRETGPQGKQLEEALARTAQKHGIRLLGPNCIGSIDTHTPVNTTFVVGMPHEGDIGFVSQSGAMVAAVIDWARAAGVGFSRIVSLGNQIDVNVTEMITAMVDDPQTKVITAYIEGIVDGRAFRKALEAAARHKPVVIIKAGQGSSGAKAVASHTGALAGSAEVYRAVFEHSGALQAEDMETLFDWARGLAWQPLPRGKRVAVLTNAGGPGILTVDALEAAGLSLAPLTDETREYLRKRLPPAASIANPVDVLAGSGPGIYGLALDALLSDPTVDAALVIQAPQDWFLPASLAEVVGEVAAVHHKPVLASIMGLASVDQASQILHQRHIPNFAFPERGASTLAAMLHRREWLEIPPEEPPAMDGVDRAAAAAALAGEHYYDLIGAYRIPVCPSRLATSAEAAVDIAEATGYPVVLKLVSPELTHKTDVGGVKLDLKDRAAVREAFKQIYAAAKTVAPEATIRGVLVQRMLRDGQEVIVGMRRDPQFGPLILVGSGGVEVELLRDVATGMAPLTRRQAEQMLASTLAGKRLNGLRGKPPADRAAVIDTMLRLSNLACDLPEISELEINPLYALPQGQGVFAVDVRGVVEKT